ncbi:MAG: hypothetical protein VZQ47_08750 [Treponema sp.]|nr:hypothetical protein [Treponema sp.]MEE3435631.1 hypothetical protein [Treponema sp.]
MKKIIKTAVVSAVVLSLFAAYAAPKKDKADSASTEKVEAAEKPAKAKKEKQAKKEKPKKEKPAKKETPAKKEKQAKPAAQKKAKFNEAEYNAALEKGDYNMCAAMLLGKGDKKNEIRDLLDVDMLLYHDANYQGSGKGFLDTYAKMQQATVSFNASEEGKAAKSSGVNRKYKGAEYERYLAWSMRLACALSMERDDVAKGIMNDYVGTFMQEIQELRAKNAQFEAEAEAALKSDEFKDAQEKLSSSGVNLSFVEPPKKSDEKYESSPFFNYLGTVAYAAYGDFDHAEEFGAVYKVPRADEITKIPAGKGRLEVVALSGMIGKRSDVSEGKEAQSVMLPIPVLNMSIPLYTKIAYPIFDKNAQTHNIKSVRVLLSNGASLNASLIEDFDEAVRIDVAQKAYGDYNRSVFRNVVKNSVVTASVIAAGIALDQASQKSPLAAAIAQIAFNASVDAAANAVANKERADVRQGFCFPNKASRAGFSVAPGTYNVTVEYLDASGKVVESKTIENVEVQAGKVSVRVSSCEK